MNNLSKSHSTSLWNKVPEITLSFWIIKLLSTTVGETVADFLAVDAGWGVGITGLCMGSALLVLLVSQLRARRYVPWLYWTTVVLVSVVGTQITDYLTDSLGIGLEYSTAAFTLLLVSIFVVWYRVERSLSISLIVTRRRELFYWAAVLSTFALGTAAGDLVTERLGLGFTLGVAVFGAAIAAVYCGRRMGAGAVLTFWLAYILTRPFGASLGDLLTQARSYGGLGLGALWTSTLFLTVICLLVGSAQMQSRD